ncbi:MAG: glycosyltransferase family 2 protein [Candidatus Methylumidiphilus sp.]
MDLSVVVPVRNEAENLKPLLAEIVQAVEGLGDCEIIYVDDGSNDGTLAQLSALRQTCPRLRVLRHRTGRGQSAALLTGIRAARGAAIATLDGDGQNDPADIPKLLHTLRERQADTPEVMVAGHRVQRQDSAWRKFTSRIANTVRGGLLGDHTPDTGCGLKVFPRALFMELPQFDHMHRFLPALAQRAGARIVGVPVNHRPRRAGVSKYGTWRRLWVGVVDLLGVIWLQRRALAADSEEIGD